jgi:cytochrome c-type biogenesis protein CcmE
MNPVRKRRLIVTLVIVAAVGIATAISVFALQQTMTYLYSPSEVIAGKAPADGVFRLGGIVAEGSVHKVSGTLQTDFVLTDRFENIPVKYTGILPDLFRVGQSTITTGRMQNGTFIATKVLAKHDATYMPPQVAQAIAKAKEEHRIPSGKLPPPQAGEGSTKHPAVIRP